MNLIDSFIVWHSKKTNGRLRSILARVYLFFARIKNRIKYGDADRFSFVNIELSRSCNRSCSYCPKSKHQKQSDDVIEFGLFKKIISNLKEINYSDKICFTGYYEPLIFDDLVKYIDHTSKELPEAKIIIYSNGEALTSELYDKLSRDNLFFIISIHEKEPSDNFTRLKEITSSEDTLFKTNLKDYILSERGGIVEVENKETKFSCIFPSLQLTIDSSGDVILCFDDYFSSYTYGNVREKNLLDIWNDPEFVKAKEGLVAGKPVKDICKNCFS